MQWNVSKYIKSLTKCKLGDSIPLVWTSAVSWERCHFCKIYLSFVKKQAWRSRSGEMLCKTNTTILSVHRNRSPKKMQIESDAGNSTQGRLKYLYCFTDASVHNTSVPLEECSLNQELKFSMFFAKSNAIFRMSEEWCGWTHATRTNKYILITLMLWKNIKFTLEKFFSSSFLSPFHPFLFCFN